MPAAGEHRAVEGDVGVRDGDRVTRCDGDLEDVERRLDLALDGRGPTRGLEREPRRVRLEQRPHAGDLPGRADRQLGHEHAATGDDLDQAAVGERPQGLADGAPRGLELGGQGDLRQPRPGRELAVDDGVADVARRPPW